MIQEVYRVLTGLGGPLISLYLERRKRRGKEDPVRFPERQGHPGRPRPPGPLVWLHGASVGEALSLLPLVERLRGRDLGVLVTTGTVTSAGLMAARLPDGAIHQYVPVDRVAYVRRFLDHWRPDLALWAESEFWPNLLAEARRRRLPMVLVQGRVSPRSARAWSRAPGFIRALLSSFALCLGQTDGDAARLKALGAPRVGCVGNLKYAVPPLPADEAALAGLGAGLAGRPVWLAASTHPGEEEIAGEVHRALEGRFPGLLTVIVPRHPSRGPEVAAGLRGQGLGVGLRSRAEDPAAAQVYVADTIGELGLFFRLCPVVFVGKSLCIGGGQNPFEPARIGCAVLFGPAMDNFPEMAPAMMAAGAAVRVADGAELARAVGDLLADPAAAAAMAGRARAWAEAEAGVLDKLVAVLAPFLEATETAHHARS